MDIFAPYSTEDTYKCAPRLSSNDVDEFLDSSKNANQFETREECRSWMENFYREWTNLCLSLDKLLDNRVLQKM